MKTSTLLKLLTGLSLCAMAACGEPDDPSANKDDNNNTTPVADMNGGGGGDPDTGGTDDPDTGGTDDPDTGGTDDPDMGGMDDPDTGGGELGECAQRALYEGQMGNPNMAKGGGGAFAIGNGSYEADSGLSNVFAAIEAAVTAGTLKGDDEDTADVREDELVLEGSDQITVTGAVVTSTSFESADDSNLFSYARRLTFQDQKIGMIMFLPFDSPAIANLTTDKDGNAIVLKVGDKVNFTVTMLKAFGGDTPQIGAIANVEKVGADGDVGVLQKTGEDLAKEDYQKMVRVHGTIESTEGSSCGGSNLCFDLKHGDKTTTLRINDGISRLPQKGDCVTYVGPLGSFPGPLSDNPTMQLDAVNFTWYRGPFAE